MAKGHKEFLEGRITDRGVGACGKDVFPVFVGLHWEELPLPLPEKGKK